MPVISPNAFAPPASNDRGKPLPARLREQVRRLERAHSAGRLGRQALPLWLTMLIGAGSLLLAGLVIPGHRTLLEVIGTSVIGSKFVEYKSEPLRRDDYSSTFTTDMMRKDVDLVLDLAGENGVELPFTSELRSLLEETSEAGHGDDDFSALLLRLNRRVEAPGPRRK